MPRTLRQFFFQGVFPVDLALGSRTQEMIREEAEHRQKKDVLWSAVEPAVAPETPGGSSGGGGGGDGPELIASLSLDVHGGVGAATEASPSPSPVAERPEAEGEGRAALLPPSPSASASPLCSGSSPVSPMTPVVAADEKERMETKAAGAGKGEIGGEEPAAVCKEDIDGKPCSSPREKEGEEEVEAAGNGAVHEPRVNEVAVGGGVESGAGSTPTTVAAGEASAFEAEDGQEEEEKGVEEQEHEEAGCTAARNGAAVNGLRKGMKAHQGWQSSAVVVAASDSNGNHAAARGKGVVEDDERSSPAAATAAADGIVAKKSSDAALVSASTEPGAGSVSAQTNGGMGQQSDGGDSMEVVEGGDEDEQKVKAGAGNGGDGDGGGEKAGGTTLKANGAGAAVKPLSAGGSGRTTRQGVRQGPPHGGAVS